MKIIKPTKNQWEAMYKKNVLKQPFYKKAWHDAYTKVFNTTPIVFANEHVLGSFVLEDHVLKFHGGEEISDYMDIIGKRHAKAAAWKEIVEKAKSLGAKKVVLNNLPQNSSSFEYFTNEKNAVLTKEDTTPHLSPPPSWEEYLSSLKRKHRKELKRKLKNFEAEYPQAKLITSKNPSKDIHLLLNLMKQNPEKEEFLTPDMEKFFRLITVVFEDEIELMFICIDSQAVSAIMSFTTDNQRLLYNSGFTKDHYSGAGFYLKANAVKTSIESEVEDYNFLQGNERYKYELGGVDEYVYKLELSLS